VTERRSESERSLNGGKDFERGMLGPDAEYVHSGEEQGVEQMGAVQYKTSSQKCW
jgi:hypothetical protein